MKTWAAINQLTGPALRVEEKEIIIKWRNMEKKTSSTGIS